MSGVYKIENRTNLKKYIGSTTNSFYYRLRRHKAQLKRGDHHNRHLQNSFKKYGMENFEFCPLLECEEKNATFYEQKLIEKFKTYKRSNGYNLERNARLKIPSEETIRRRNKKIRGRKLTDEHKKKISESMTGKTMKEKTRKKLSESHKGKKLSESHKRKISESRKGTGNEVTKLDEEQVAKIKKLLSEGDKTQEEISNIFDVHQVNISAISTGKTWDHVECEDQ